MVFVVIDIGSSFLSFRYSDFVRLLGRELFVLSNVIVLDFGFTTLGSNKCMVLCSWVLFGVFAL